MECTSAVLKKMIVTTGSHLNKHLLAFDQAAAPGRWSTRALRSSNSRCTSRLSLERLSRRTRSSSQACCFSRSFPASLSLLLLSTASHHTLCSFSAVFSASACSFRARRLRLR